MLIERLSVHQISGIASLPATRVSLIDGVDRELSASGLVARGQTARVTAIITNDVDDLALPTDRRIAIANLILGGGLSLAKEREALDVEIGQLKARRREQFGDGPYLVCRISKEIDRQSREPAMGIVCEADFDLIVEGPGKAEFLDFRRQAREVELQVLGALRLVANPHIVHKELSTAAYLLVDERIEYRLWLEAGSGGIRASLNLTPEAANDMAYRVLAVLRTPEGSTALDLVGRASVDGLDQTVEFLVSFVALEQYVKAIVTTGDLVSRFERMTSTRFQEGAEAEADLQEFRNLYHLRNNLAHEGLVPTDRSYAARTRALLARYLT